MHRLFAYTSLLALLLCCLVAAAAEPVFPALTGRVVDQASLLSTEQRDSLTSLLKKHEQETSNQLVVVTLKSLQGYSIEEFGYQLGRHWGIGQKDRNNGVLLIVAPNERKVRIEVGYGLEGVLTDFLANDIIQNKILPHFRDKQYAFGISAGVRAIIQSLQGSYEPVKPRKPSPLTATLLIIALVFGVYLIIVILDYHMGKRVVVSGVLALMAFVSSIALIDNFILSLVISVLSYFFYSAISKDLRSQAGKPSKGSRSYGWNDHDDFGGGGFGGGSFGGGGGFSGGGGSFGGGGSSGSW